MKVPFIANIWGLWHLQGTEYTYERTESNGSAKELGKTISFSHRKFLSQKGQNLAANIKGKQYMESIIGCYLQAEPMQVFSHHEIQQQPKLLDSLAISDSLLLFKGEGEMNVKTGQGIYMYCTSVQQNAQVMTRRPTCTWAFQCCSFKAFQTTNAKRSF